MDELTIGEVARRAGLRPSALRYYESVGILPPPQRVSGQRRYDATALQRIALIQLAQRAGFTIAEIRKFVEQSDDTAPSALWHAFAPAKLAEIDALIAEAQHKRDVLEAGLDCHCQTLDECVLCSERAIT